MEDCTIINLKNGIKIKKTYSYKFEISFFSETSKDSINIIFKSIESILNNCKIYSNNIITFYANNVNILERKRNKEEIETPKKINYNEGINIIKNLMHQISNIEKENYTFYTLDPQQIIEININNEREPNKYIYLGLDYIIPINKKTDIHTINFLSPREKTGIMSPEVINIRKLPSSVTYKSIYYSLAIFIFNHVLNEKYTNLNTQNNLDEIHEIDKYILSKSSQIKNTELYWYIIKNASINPNNRTLFFTHTHDKLNI